MPAHHPTLPLFSATSSPQPALPNAMTRSMLQNHPFVAPLRSDAAPAGAASAEDGIHTTGSSPNAASEFLPHKADTFTAAHACEGQFGPITLSPRATGVLMSRARSATSESMGETISTLLEWYLDIVEMHGHEAEFAPDDAAIVYEAVVGFERANGTPCEVGRIEDSVRAYLRSLYDSAAGGTPVLVVNWHESHLVLMAQIRDLSAAGEAAVLDRVRLAANAPWGDTPLVERLRTVGLIGRKPRSRRVAALYNRT